MLLHRHHYAKRAQERYAPTAPTAEWAQSISICGTKTANWAQDDPASVTRRAESEPEAPFEHACKELMRWQGGVPKVACFALKSGSSRSQGWLFWSQCSVTPPKSVRIAAKKGTYRSTKRVCYTASIACLCQKAAKMCTYRSMSVAAHSGPLVRRQKWGSNATHGPCDQGVEPVVEQV